MKYSAVVVAALAAAASAQDISIFPSCSLPCILDAVSSATSCQATDYPCICKNMDTLTAAATGCVVDKCGADVALNKVLPATKQFCASVGSGSSGSSSAAGTTSTSVAVTDTTTATTVTSAAQSESSSAAATTTTSSSTSTVAVVTTTASNSTATKTSTTPSAVVTAGAATLGSFGAAAMLMIAAFAL